MVSAQSQKNARNSDVEHDESHVARSKWGNAAPLQQHRVYNEHWSDSGTFKLDGQKGMSQAFAASKKRQGTVTSNEEPDDESTNTDSDNTNKEEFGHIKKISRRKRRQETKLKMLRGAKTIRNLKTERNAQNEENLQDAQSYPTINVARSVGRAELNSEVKAKAATTKEWTKLWEQDIWDATITKGWNQVTGKQEKNGKSYTLGNYLEYA